MVHFWKAFYADAEFSSETTAWEDLPSEGLLLLDLYEGQEYAPGQRPRRRCTSDWYGYSRALDSYVSFDEGEQDRSLYQDAVWSWKRGRLVDDATMRDVVRRARRSDESHDDGSQAPELQGDCPSCP